MSTRGDTVNTSTSKTKSPHVEAERPSISKINNPRYLVTHQKKRKRPKYLRSVIEELNELSETAGDKAREELLSIRLSIHDMNPSREGAKNIALLLTSFELEKKIENNDPISFDDAVSRVQQDVDRLFSDIAGDDIGRRFFSAFTHVEAQGRPSHTELEARWMTRWITPLEGPRRGVDEWSKLIGFAGEYLVIVMLFVY
jgi:hypothetical protein